MKTIFSISLISLLFFCSCEKHHRVRPSGQIVSETYTFNNAITGIDASHGTKVIINQGDTDKCIVYIDDNVRPYLTLRQSNGVIHAHFENVSFVGHHPEVTIHLTVRDLRKVSLSGGSECSIFNTEDNTYNNLEIQLSGASTCIGEITAQRIDAELNGASELRLTGVCESLEIDLSGASEAYGYDMVCDHLEADLSGASEAYYTVLKTLSVDLSGASLLRYDGDPRIVERDVSGGSELKPR